MTIHRVTPTELEHLAFDHPGNFIHVGAHSATLRVEDEFYVAPLDAA